MNTRLDETTANDPIDPLRSSRRKWIFPLIAVSIPCLIGALFLVLMLVWQERLVFDSQSGLWKLQAAPIYFREPGHQISGQVSIYDERFGWKNVPNTVSTTFGRKLTINSHGHRGPERSLSKPPGVSRVLVLGDSFTWGYGVADDEVFPAQLQRLLDQAGGGWEVINTGVSGWGTDQEYLYLQSEGFRFQPDVVVLALFVGNDPSENMLSLRYGLQKPVFLDAELTPANLPVPKPDDNAPEQRSRAGPAALTLAIVEAIQRACAENGCELAVMKFGSILLPADVNQTGDPVMREVVAELGQLEQELPRLLGRGYFDLDRQLVALGVPPEQLVRGDDHHFNARGHHKTAKLLYEFLVARELVP